MMRPAVLVVALTLATAPAGAWRFDPLPICTLSDEGSPTSVTVTFDGNLYAIHLTHPDGWPDAPRFAIRFAPNGPQIATDRHRVEGRTLTVTDTGFGNVLNGLQSNGTATALIGGLARDIDLSGAASAVAAFRQCPEVPTV